jgi:hypothetical protein
VAVEKLNLSKLVEKTLRWDALQTTFLVFQTFCNPPNFGGLGEKWTFSTATRFIANYATQWLELRAESSFSPHS